MDSRELKAKAATGTSSSRAPEQEVSENRRQFFREYRELLQQLLQRLPLFSARWLKVVPLPLTATAAPAQTASALPTRTARMRHSRRARFRCRGKLPMATSRTRD